MSTSLITRQRQMRDAVLGQGPLEGLSARLSIYRNTVFASLHATLCAHYPSVARLVGDDCMQAIAQDYISAHPPSAPCMAEYGAHFADMIAVHPALAGLPYLPDMARLDWALVVCSRAAPWDDDDHGVQMPISPDACLRWPSSLSVLRIDYPVDEIRSCLENGDDAQLAAIDMTPMVRHGVLWRGVHSTHLRLVPHGAGAFVRAAMAGADAAQACEAALEAAPDADIADILHTHILPAPFVRLMTGERT